MDDVKNKIHVLVAEDDADDFFLIQKAFEENCPEVKLEWVKDGEELMEFLHKKEYQKWKGEHAPIILLDLNMPRKDGRQALEEIKNDPNLCVIPVIVFTTSNAPADMRRVYRLGAAAYVLKPTDYPEFINFVNSFKNWLERIALPTLESLG